MIINQIIFPYFFIKNEKECGIFLHSAGSFIWTPPVKSGQILVTTVNVNGRVLMMSSINSSLFV